MRLIPLLFMLAGAISTAYAEDVFSVDGRVVPGSNAPPTLQVRIRCPNGYHLYADSIRVESTNAVLQPLRVPAPVSKYDPFSETNSLMYETDFEAVYSFTGLSGRHLHLRVGYRGCSDSVCYFPVTTNMLLAMDGTRVQPESAPSGPVVPPAPVVQSAWRDIAGSFTVTGRKGGYISSGDFIGFLADGQAGRISGAAAQSLWISVILFILGGITLNLTPCVLPMIPINLAIIGAGVQSESGSRKRGFVMGLLYGAGMAVAYGSLGLIVVLTGAMFGTLAASPWFNLAIAGVFILLGLGMFGVVNIDFSRFQGTARASHSGWIRYAVVPSMGAVSALLAGACVAPVVITALTLSLTLYSQGVTAAALLPFLVGLGMALPWPLAAAGLAVLPKPGRWMEYVKYGFGVLIVGLAIFYGFTAYDGFRWRMGAQRDKVQAAQERLLAREGWTASMAEGLARARAERKPVFIDVWASWCKNCLAMEESTFRDPAVREKLQSFVKIKYRMEDPGEADARQIREYFGFVGLPAYIILVPKPSQ